MTSIHNNDNVNDTTKADSIAYTICKHSKQLRKADLMFDRYLVIKNDFARDALSMMTLQQLINKVELREKQLRIDRENNLLNDRDLYIESTALYYAFEYWKLIQRDEHMRKDYIGINKRMNKQQ